MTTFIEGDLKVEFHDVVAARKFDGDSHGLSHCMKAVDFVVELADRYLFIEFKDPDNPHSRTSDRQRFIDDLRDGRLDDEFKYKYRDTFLYEWASGRNDKPIYYLVLIALDSPTEAGLNERMDSLKRNLPVRRLSPDAWARPIVEDCAVLNLQAWNRIYSQYPVMRLSASSSSELTAE